MKTASDWLSLNGTTFTGDGWATKAIADVKTVEQIQLDAFKAGMERAAEVVFETHVANLSEYSPASECFCAIVNQASRTILTDKDNLKELL